MSYTIHHGDALTVLRTMPDESVNMCVTSPPYFGLRDYGVSGQIGLEKTPEAFVSVLADVFDEVWRVLKPEGTLWLNLGDSYYSNNPGSGGKCVLPGAGKSMTVGRYHTNTRDLSETGLKPKDLIGIPWRVAFELQKRGWYLRSDIIWHKTNPMPESVTDRPTKAHEYVFLLSKSERYWYDSDAIKEQATCGWNGSSFDDERDLKLHPNIGKKPRPSAVKGTFNGKTEAMADTGQNAFRSVTDYRNKRTVWTLATLPTPDAHFATYPIELPETCIRAGCPVDGIVLDPFSGAGTTGLAAIKNGRRYVGIELNAEYIQISYNRARRHYPLLVAEASA
jgi:DNA modification methylase